MNIPSISIVVLILFLAALVIAGTHALIGSIKWLKKRDEIHDKIMKIKTPEDWKNSKKEVVDYISNSYKKRYVHEETAGSLYGSLADKAEELFNKKPE